MTRFISSHAQSGVAPDFDRLARIYKWMEWLSFGPLLGRCRRAFLPRMTSRRRALVIGDGDGRFTATLLRTNPNVNIEAVDASRAMLNEMLRRTQPHHARLHTHIADARQWQPPAHVRYDLVATHFFLDCLTTQEISSLAKSIRPALEPDALWVISEFGLPKGWFGRLFAHTLIAFLYRAFAVLTGLSVRRLPDHRAALRGTGWKLLDSRRFFRGLLVSELWALDLR
jgi:ubiquinone/menaquinone biosynthesis C-methylase UbiE